MKKFGLHTLFFATALLFACNSEKPAQDADAQQQDENVGKEIRFDASIYNVDVENSKVFWKGSKPTGTHEGTLNLATGRIATNGEKLIAGQFTFDMQSIEVVNEDPSTKEKLENHLKSDDFFSVDSNPTAEFEISQTQPLEGMGFVNYNVIGALTMKGIKKPVKVPALVTLDGDKLKVSTPWFRINRTEWGITYRSGILGTVADKIISDKIEMRAELVALPR